MPQYDIEIRNTNVASDLPDCVIVLDFAKASADCQAWLYSNAKSDGTDIRVYLSDGVTQINHDLISFSKPGTDQVAGYMRILIPNVDSSANTPLRLDCDGSRSDGSTTATYPSAWRGYWTLDQDPSGSAPQMVDRTAGASHGISAGAMSSGQSVSGQVGNALSLDGINDKITFANESQFDFDVADPFTLCAFVKTTQTASNAYGILAKYSAGGVGYFMALYGGGIYIQIQQGGSNYKYRLPSVSVADGNWHHVGVTYDGSNTLTGLKIYVDGVLDPSTNTGQAGTITSLLNNDSLELGYRTAGGNYFPGQVDEAVVIASAMPADAFAFAHANATSSDNEIDYIGEVVVGTAKPWLYRRGSQMIGGGIL